MNKSVSPSRSYVVMASKPNFEGYKFKKFVLPETDPESDMPLGNDSDVACWYYLNRVDQFDCADGTVSFEDYISGFPAKSRSDYVLTHLSEARRLLKHIQQDASNGQISDITRDIGSFFEKYPYLEWVTEETTE